MPEITVTLDELTLSRAEQYAQERGKAVEGLISELLKSAICTRTADDLRPLFEAMDRAMAHGQESRWNRSDAYDN